MVRPALSLMSMRMTRTPFLMNSVVVALPIPLAAPVVRATFLASLQPSQKPVESSDRSLIFAGTSHSHASSMLSKGEANLWAFEDVKK
jgi:hypothetical protein